MDPSPFPSTAWPWLVFVFVLAGTVKGITGLGLPTVAMALLAWHASPAAAAALMLVPALLTNLAQCAGPHLPCLARRLWPMWAGVAFATVASPWDAAAGATRVLGAVLVLHGAWGLWRPAVALPARHAGWTGCLAGLAAGALSAATGVFVVPLVAWLQALRLERDAMVQALGLSFTVAAVALGLRLGRAGHGASLDPLAVALALGGAFAGMAVGARLRHRLAPAAFQRALNAVLVLLGAQMLGRSP